MQRLLCLRRSFLFAILVVFPLLLPAGAAGCEYCYSTWLNPTRSYCKPVAEFQTGVTNCQTFVDNLGGSSCTESGTYCTDITVGGGDGSGGGSGGGSGSCQYTGFCPAECFSCSGSGGRPAI